MINQQGAVFCSKSFLSCRLMLQDKEWGVQGENVKYVFVISRSVFESRELHGCEIDQVNWSISRWDCSSFLEPILKACSHKPRRQAADNKRKAGAGPKLHLQNKYGIPCLINNHGALCLHCMWSVGALRVQWWTSSPLSPWTEHCAGIVGLWE